MPTLANHIFKMPEEIDHRKIFTLQEVTQSIRQTISKRYTAVYWVKAEMNKLNLYPHSGHCYPDLLQKKDGQVVAQMRGTLWKQDYERVNANFMKYMHEPLSDGVQLLMLTSIHFDANYGLTLRISDIDTAYTLGDLEKEKRETMLRLQKEGVFNLNKTLPFPLLPKRVAVISVSSSKGYADFLQITQARMKGFVMEHHLFPSLLQGEQAVNQITTRLKQIESIQQHFDLVAIVRGGGGDVGLAIFNQYQLAYAIATFPLPVLTGIGHATNSTVTEMVAHSAASTPSELADMLMDRFEIFTASLNHAAQKLLKSKQVMEKHKQRLQDIQRSLPRQSRQMLSMQQHTFSHQLSRLKLSTSHQMQTGHNQLRAIQHLLPSHFYHKVQVYRQQLSLQTEQLKKNSFNHLKQKLTGLYSLETNLRLLDPQQLLKRGYSMSFQQGKLINSIQQVKQGMTIVTRFYDGEAISTIESTKKQDGKS